MKVSPGNTMLRTKDGCPEYKENTQSEKVEMRCKKSSKNTQALSQK